MLPQALRHEEEGPLAARLALGHQPHLELLAQLDARRDAELGPAVLGRVVRAAHAARHALVRVHVRAHLEGLDLPLPGRPAVRVVVGPAEDGLGGRAALRLGHARLHELGRRGRVLVEVFHEVLGLGPGRVRRRRVDDGILGRRLVGVVVRARRVPPHDVHDAAPEILGDPRRRRRRAAHGLQVERDERERDRCRDGDERAPAARRGHGAFLQALQRRGARLISCRWTLRRSARK
mmetsp:Transcript_14311/g.42708  ORF Transcript_14311/g.42708 Transcript_14311/m.42708 type:complete len:235 (-) Transcript_14311:180-884(-)